MGLPDSLDWVSRVSMMVGFAEPLDSLRSEHIGLFWNRVREEYPKVEQSLPYPRSFNASRLLSMMSQGQFPMSDFHFSSVDGRIGLLVQQDRLRVSWHRDPDGPMDFDGFFVPTSRRACGLFEDFARDELNVAGISTGVCEVTFGGRFDYPGASPECDLRIGLLGSCRPPDIGVPLSQPAESSFTYFYHLESGLHIQVDGDVEFFDVGPPRMEFGLNLEGSQRLDQAGMSEVGGWLESAYESILNCYLRLIA